MDHCPECGTRQRSSMMYDDRDPDTLKSLLGINKVCEVGEPPTKVFFIVPREDDGSSIRFDIARYHRVDVVKDETLRKLIVDLIEAGTISEDE